MLSRSILRFKHRLGSRQFSTIASPLKQDFYHFDINRTNKREPYGKVLKLRDGRSIRFEIADEKDVDLIANQFCDGFTKHTSMLRAINAKREDLIEMMYEMTRETLLSRGTLLGFHEDILACFRLVRYVKHDNLAQAFGPLAQPGDPAPTPVFPKDYGVLIDAVDRDSFAARVVSVLLSVPESQLGKFLPLDIKNLAFGEAVNVHDDFKQLSLGTYISTLSEKFAVENDCNYIANITVATASSRIAAKKGYKVLYSMPYNEFYVHGKLIFENLWDGATEANLNLGSIK